MNKNELEQLVDRCLARDIDGSKVIEILDYEFEKQWRECKYIYLENIALRYFCTLLESHYDQGIENLSDIFFIKQVLDGEKSCFNSFTLRIPRLLHPKARWLLELVQDSEWAILRKLITEYRETRFLDFAIREKYTEMAKTLESNTIIDVVRKILYSSIAKSWWVDEWDGKKKFRPGQLYGQEADPLDYTNKLLKMIDCCEGKSFFIVAVNYLNGQPNIFITS